jgi:prepilin-type N-terminal cleavage/methylation domain-containing protein
MNKTHAYHSRSKASGFSLIELMIAMTVFLVIGGAALSLFKQHTALFTVQQNQVGLNISMRNALSQMEMDVVNAGTGFYNAAPISSFPVGITVQNNAGAIDTLNIVSPDPATPPAHPDDGTGVGCMNTFTSNKLYLVPVPNSGLTAANFAVGDELLLMTGGTTVNGRNQMTTVVVVAPGAVAGPGTEITLTTTQTDNLGQNATDPAGLAKTVDTSIGDLGVNFCSATDWVVKLAQPIAYTVNGANQLQRSQGATVGLVADQILSFKVGAATFNGAAVGGYNYGAPAYKADEIRSLRISLVGRTAVNPNDSFRNAFDGGKYKIEALSVVVNPRNLSMN